MSRSYFTLAAAASALAGLLPSELARPNGEALSHALGRASVTCVNEKTLVEADPGKALLLMLGEFQPLEPVVGWSGSKSVGTDVEASWIEAIPVPGPAAACLLAMGAMLPPKRRSGPVRCGCCGRWHAPE